MINHLQTLTSYKAYFLSWESIAGLLTGQVQLIIGRTIPLWVWPEDYDYWGIEAKETKFTLAELECLLKKVSATVEECKDTLPVEGTTKTRCLGMDLGRKLLMCALAAEWQCECVTEKGLWLVGVSGNANHPGSHSNLLRELDKEKLLSVEDVLTLLRINGNTDRALSYIREQYVNLFNNQLCWRYPISDGLHMGTFILVVQEGYLSLSYNSIDENDYEILIPEDAALHDADSLSTFLSDWKSFSDDLSDAMQEMRTILKGGAYVKTFKTEVP